MATESTPIRQPLSPGSARRNSQQEATESTGIHSAREFGHRCTYGIFREIEEHELAEERVDGQYDIDKLITWKVFWVFDGTVFKSAVLWEETGMLAILYWGLFWIMLANRWEGFADFIGKESSIRAFLSMFSTLIGLLLSFYTALNLKRWWDMREAVENIEEGCKKLTMLISQITHDELLLKTINRYARASLFLIFAASQREPGKNAVAPRIKALEKKLLTQEEADKLEILNPHMAFVQAETLWVWLANVVTRLHNQGLTKGPPHYCALISAASEGRTGVSLVQTYLETPIPLGYVHLLCMMVKLHNFLLTVLMCMTTVMLAGGKEGFQAVGVFRTAFRAFFMPFLYNAILVLNQDMTDPFGEDSSDFRFNTINTNLKASEQSTIDAATILPQWLEKADFASSKV